VPKQQMATSRATRGRNS